MYSGVVLVFPIGLGTEIGSTTSLGCPSGSARRESVVDRSRASRRVSWGYGSCFSGLFMSLIIAQVKDHRQARPTPRGVI